MTKLRDPLLASTPKIDIAFAVAEGKPADARIQLRGEPKNLGESVPRGFLEVISKKTLPEGASSGRLQLAQWLTDPSNALAPRVMVNRIWQHHFGRGLVATPSDFGRRGMAPTHPELLDYLADRFVKSGWRIKTMHRELMLSETYRLSNGGPVANLEI